MRLDLDAVTAPGEPWELSVDGAPHVVTKPSVWDVFRVRRLDEAVPEQMQEIRAFIGQHLPTVPAERIDAFTPDEYLEVIWFLLNGEPRPERPTSATPDTTP